MKSQRQLKGIWQGGVMALALGIAMPATAADVESVDWSKVKARKVRMFYPGQSSYEWLRDPEHKKADQQIKDGEACLECHKGEQKSLGEILVEENRLEDNPIADKVSYLRMGVQAAFDSTYLYMRFQWKTAADKPGDMGNFLRFDGSEWQWYGNHRQHEAVIDEGQPAIYPDRLGIMIGDAQVDKFPNQGCWMTCHNNLVGMPDQADEDEVSEHPVIGQLYKAFGIKNYQVRKYIPESRDDPADWAAVKSEADLKALREQGKFLDLLIWDAALTNPIGVAADFNVLEIKKVDEGTSPLLPNGKMRGGPAFVFDEGKVGFKTLSEADLGDASKAKHLIIGKTAAKADGVAFKEGDILPAHVLDKGSAKGSAADLDYAKGTWADGQYTVVMRRKLDTGNHMDDRVLKPGSVYGFGFSIHDDAAGKRAHLVSYPISVSIGPGTADIQAAKLN